MKRLVCWLRNHHTYGPIVDLYSAGIWYSGRVCHTCEHVNYWPTFPVESFLKDK